MAYTVGEETEDELLPKLTFSPPCLDLHSGNGENLTLNNISDNLFLY